MVNTCASGAYVARHGGSSPLSGTNEKPNQARLSKRGSGFSSSFFQPPAKLECALAYDSGYVEEYYQQVAGPFYTYPKHIPSIHRVFPVRRFRQAVFDEQENGQYASEPNPENR